MQNFLSNKAKKEIDNAEVISFDVFDTLLLRPYAKPQDLFWHIEKAYSRVGFCEERRAAERRARLRHRELEDITYDMIYEEIDDKFKDLKQTETDWEKMVLRANPEMKKVYEYAKERGKRIVIASDMYLSGVFIAEVLNQNGYDAWDKLYVSGDINARKGNGGLFSYIAKDLKVNPNSILHIGDNLRSDFRIPRKNGLRAMRYIPVYKQFMNSLKRYGDIKSKADKSLGLSILTMVLAIKWIGEKSGTPQSGYWRNLGFCYAGAAGYAYCRFIEKVARQNANPTLLFVARDGWLLQKIFALLETDIKYTYIYAPRFVDYVCNPQVSLKNKKQASAVVDFYAKRDDKVKSLLLSNLDPLEIITQNQELFAKLALSQKKLYQRYLQKNIPRGERIASIDTITGEFSSQKILQNALDKQILGIYWGVVYPNNADKYKHCTFAGMYDADESKPLNRIFTDNWNFMEFLITSPEHPVKNIDENGNPIHAENESIYELRRSELYPEIAAGAVEFAANIKEWFSGHDIYLSSTDVINWVNAYINYPTSEDIKKMSDIRFGEDAAHEVWTPLFCSDIGLKDFIKSPFNSLKIIKKLVWKTPTQTFLLSLGRPIEIKNRGLKQISITFFPYWQKRYLTFEFALNKRINYTFAIGKKGKK